MPRTTPLAHPGLRLALGALVVAGCAASAERASSPYPTSSASSGSVTASAHSSASAGTGAERESPAPPARSSVSAPAAGYSPPPPPPADRPAMTNGGFATPPMVAPASTPPSPAAQPEPGAEAPRQEGPGERITAWQAEIERYHAAITAPVSDCRDICGAAGGICQASREICRLTGDAAEARAHDPRCQRSREACTDASRRRDAACAVCPPLR